MNLPLVDRPSEQRLIVAETGAECETAVALMLVELGCNQPEDLVTRSTVAVVGLDTEWAPPGKESAVCLALAFPLHSLPHHTPFK